MEPDQPPPVVTRRPWPPLAEPPGTRPPPVIVHGPWRGAGPAAPPPPPSEPGWGTTLWDTFSGLFDVIDLDLIELVFGFFRVIAHVVVVAVHAVFHL